MSNIVDITELNYIEINKLLGTPLTAYDVCEHLVADGFNAVVDWSGGPDDKYGMVLVKYVEIQIDRGAVFVTRRCKERVDHGRAREHRDHPLYPQPLQDDLILAVEASLAVLKS